MTTGTADLADLLEEAGLTGRGGAAYSTAVKVRAATGAGATLLVNACDGELGAAKDAYVVEHHLAELVDGANRLSRNGFRIAAHRGSATAERLAAAGLPLLPVPARYVSSEESALVSLANGGLARPLTKRVPVVFGGTTPSGRALPPTVVLNAETVWRVSQVAARGPAWFRSAGTPEEPGPRLATVTGAVRTPRVVETQAGTPVAELLDAAGGPTGPVLGVGVGGLSGGWLTSAEAAGAVWSRAGLAAYGIGPGPGSVLVLGGPGCALHHVARTLQFAAGESAGQCGPCLFGVPAVAEDVAALAALRLDTAGWHRLSGRLGLLPGRGACRFPDGVAGYARSALRAFTDEVDAHRAGRCTAASSTSPWRSDVVAV